MHWGYKSLTYASEIVRSADPAKTKKIAEKMIEIIDGEKYHDVLSAFGMVLASIVSSMNLSEDSKKAAVMAVCLIGLRSLEIIEEKKKQ